VAEPQNINSGLVATAGISTCFIVLALVIGTHAYFHYEVDEETKLKSQVNWDPTIPDAVAAQKASLQSPKGPGQLPISKAKELYIQKHARQNSTAQAPTGGATIEQP